MYDVKFRKLVLRMVRQVGVMKTASFCSLSRTTIWRWKRLGIMPKNKIERPQRVFQSVGDSLRVLLQELPCASASKYQQMLKARYDINVSTKSLYAFIRRLGFSRKRTRWRGVSTASVEHQRLLRTSFVQRYADTCRNERRIIAIDECGFSERVQALYGWSPKGIPLVVKRKGSWTNHSLLMAVSSSGDHVYEVYKGAITRPIFTSFLDRLAANDSQQSMFVMDNASIHKGLQLRNGVDILYTPPYSPEFNAIELVFAKIKHAYRTINSSLEASSVTDLVHHSVQCLSSTDVTSCFHHVERLIMENITI